MWMTSRELSLHPAVLTALLGQIRNPAPESLKQLDRHLLRDIGIDPARARMPSLSLTKPESPAPQRSQGLRVA